MCFYPVDICDKSALRQVFSKHNIECVLHIAALKSVSESFESPLKYYGVNVAGSIHLVEIMAEFGVKKLLFSSSSTVFGEPDYLPIDENHPTGNCINPYGRTKYFFEELMRDMWKSRDYKVNHKGYLPNFVYPKHKVIQAPVATEAKVC